MFQEDSSTIGLKRERDDDDDDEKINTITEMVKLIFYLYFFY